jgi:hypothetical protein
VPKVSTIYSNENFQIAIPSEDLKGRQIFGNSPNYELAFDGKLLEKPSEFKYTCNVGLSFKEGHVGMLSQVKYFMGIVTKQYYSGWTTFQGSNDNSTWTDLF